MVLIGRISAVIFFKHFAGTFSAEVLSPDGRIPVNVDKPDNETVRVGFTAKVEGKRSTRLNTPTSCMIVFNKFKSISFVIVCTHINHHIFN